jgi:hypothetical protein
MMEEKKVGLNREKVDCDTITKRVLSNLY